MRLHIEQEVGYSVDRSGDADPSRNMRQGFHIHLDDDHGAILLEFEDEADAELVALAVLQRLGYDIKKGEYHGPG